MKKKTFIKIISLCLVVLLLVSCTNHIQSDTDSFLTTTIQTTPYQTIYHITEPSVITTTETTFPPKSPVLERIEIFQYPHKMTYSISDSIVDNTGLELKLYYSNGDTEIINSGYTFSPSRLSFENDFIIVYYQGREVDIFVDFIDEREKLQIPNIYDLSIKEAEILLKNAKIPYKLIYDSNPSLLYDDIPPIPYISGYGGYHWDVEKDIDYIYENEILEVYVNSPSIYITSVSHDINSADGVNVEIDVTNCSDKIIKYIHFNDVEFYNTVADPAYCSIRDIYKRTLSYTGPLYEGTSKTIYWDAVIYNNKTSALVFRTITVEFVDGSSQTINYDVYWYDDRYIGGYPG